MKRVTFHPRGYRDGKQAHQNMFHLISHQENATSNHNEISLYTHPNGKNKNQRHHQMPEKKVKKLDHYILLVRMENNTTNLDNNWAAFLTI